jgi:hypothetical protein
LLGAPLFGNGTILRRDGIRIDELLSKDVAEPRAKNHDRAGLQGKSNGPSA